LFKGFPDAKDISFCVFNSGVQAHVSHLHLGNDRCLVCFSWNSSNAYTYKLSTEAYVLQNMKAFHNLGLSPDIVDTLEKKGYKTPTAIQEKTIPLLLKGDVDVIGQAQTGTGKTASFSLPIIESITPGTGYVQAMILAPTRELAIQVASEMESLQGKRRLRVLAIYGGSSIMNQVKALKKGVDVVVGTPGRVMDLMRRKSLHVQHLSYMVLDEADEMLNMGFLDDIKWVLSHTKQDKRMLFFSATMPPPILAIAKKFMRQYVVVKIESQGLTIDTVDQVYYLVKSTQRYSSLRRIIAVNKGFHGIVFCKTRRNVDELAQRLQNDGYAAAALHGDISQAHRGKILHRFRNGNLRIMVATDVAARGIDVEDMTHVVNYSLPQSPEVYVHRIGRTGRAGKTGVAVTFVLPNQTQALRDVERLTKKSIRRERLPAIEEVIQSKKDDLVRTVRRIINKRDSSQFSDVCDVLLAEDDPREVVSALLKHAMQHEVDTNGYETEVVEYVAKEARFSGRSKGKKVRRARGHEPRQDRGASKKRSRRGPRGKF
jgi:ATP-dependent RNA helicase DeaD